MELDMPKSIVRLGILCGCVIFRSKYLTGQILDGLFGFWFLKKARQN